MSDAKNRFTASLRAEGTQEVTLTGNGKPIAEIVPARSKRKPEFGTLTNEAIVIDPEWNRPQNDVEAWLHGDV